MKKNILVVNPISGGMDKATMLSAINDFAAMENIELIIYTTSGNNDNEKIAQLYNKHQPDRVIVAGGDGTIKLVAEALEQYDVVLGILPAGSANGLATDLGLPDTIEENLSIAFNNPAIALDMISINGKKCIHLSDLGLNALLIKNYENGNTRGMLGYAMQAISTLSEQQDPFTATITTDDRSIETVARMVVVANSNKYGTGVTINPDGLMTDGKFEIVILKNLDLIVFGKIISGYMPVESGDVEIISTDRATITTDVPVDFQIDGEYDGLVTKLDVRILPAQMKIATIPEEQQP